MSVLKAHQGLLFTPGGPPPAGDPYFANVVSLLHFDGADLSTSFPDVTGKVWTPGGGTDIRVAEFKFGGASGRFPRSYLSTPHHADWDFGSGEFTGEGWFRLSAIDTVYNAFVCHDNISVARGWLLYKDTGAGGAITFTAYVGATAYTVAGSGAPATGAFVFVSIVRDVNTLRLRINGVQVGSTAITGAINNPSIPCYMGTLIVSGSPGSVNDRPNGYLDDWRWTKGICRYPGSGSYAVPTAAFPNSA